MNWIKVAQTSEVTGDLRKVVEVGSQKILLLSHGGVYYAVENSCPHLKLPLKGGKIENNCLVCPFHHSAFELTTGQVKAWSTFPPLIGPVLGAVSGEKPLTTFPTRSEDGSIFVGVTG